MLYDTKFHFFFLLLFFKNTVKSKIKKKNTEINIYYKYIFSNLPLLVVFFSAKNKKIKNTGEFLSCAIFQKYHHYNF